jgi:hypothetical protein
MMVAMPPGMYPPQMPGATNPNSCDQSMYSFMTADTARTQFAAYSSLPGQQQPVGMPMMLIPVQMPANPDSSQPQGVMYMLAPMMPAAPAPAPLEQILESAPPAGDASSDAGLGPDPKGRRSPSKLSLSRKLSIKNLLSRKPTTRSHGTPA